MYARRFVSFLMSAICISPASINFVIRNFTRGEKVPVMSFSGYASSFSFKCVQVVLELSFKHTACHIFVLKCALKLVQKWVGHKYMFRDRLAETVTRYKSALLDHKHTGTLKGKDIWCPLRVCCKGHLPLYQSPQSSLRPLLVLCVSMHCNTSPSVEIYAHELSLCYAAALS